MNPKLSAASRLGDTSGIGESAPSAVPGRPGIIKIVVFLISVGWGGKVCETSKISEVKLYTSRKVDWSTHWYSQVRKKRLMTHTTDYEKIKDEILSLLESVKVNPCLSGFWK